MAAKISFIYLYLKFGYLFRGQEVAVERVVKKLVKSTDFIYFIYILFYFILFRGQEVAVERVVKKLKNIVGGWGRRSKPLVRVPGDLSRYLSRYV